MIVNKINRLRFDKRVLSFKLVLACCIFLQAIVFAQSMNAQKKTEGTTTRTIECSSCSGSGTTNCYVCKGGGHFNAAIASELARQWFHKSIFIRV